MTPRIFPELNPQSIVGTRGTLHSYSLVLGNYLTAYRPKRKHWWHISLRPSLEGMTTGPVRGPGQFGPADFQLELNPGCSLVCARTSNGAELDEQLHGQPASELANNINDFLTTNGLDPASIPESVPGADNPTADCSTDIAATLAIAWNSISAAMEEFRAGIPEETSPVQLWPHHFDLAMMWLPGEKIPGKDPVDEENADKQMSFGFTFGDTTIAEPYFYITAYSLPEAFPTLKSPTDTIWHTEGFSGAVLPYRSLVQSADPNGYLLDLWNNLLSAGRTQMIANTT